MNKYEKHAVPFMIRSYRNNVVGDIVYAENDALEYIKTSSDFNKKDILAAGALVMELEKSNFLKYIEKRNEIRYFKLTLEGINAINR